MADDDDDRDRYREDDYDRRREDDDDRPRSREETPPAEDIASRPMPMPLMGAIIASLFWGGLLLHGSCVSFTHSVMGVISHHNAVFGWEGRGGGAGEGFFGTKAAAEFFMLLLAATLLAAGILLMMRKGFAKWMAMAAPVLMVLLQMATAVVCLIITGGTFLAQHNFDFLITITFSLAVGGANAYFLLNKEVAQVLR
jgi:hypothetical protein